MEHFHEFDWPLCDAIPVMEVSGIKSGICLSDEIVWKIRTIAHGVKHRLWSKKPGQRISIRTTISCQTDNQLLGTATFIRIAGIDFLPSTTEAKFIAARRMYSGHLKFDRKYQRRKRRKLEATTFRISGLYRIADPRETYLEAHTSTLHRRRLHLCIARTFRESTNYILRFGRAWRDTLDARPQTVYCHRHTKQCPLPTLGGTCTSLLEDTTTRAGSFGLSFDSQIPKWLPVQTSGVKPL